MFVVAVELALTGRARRTAVRVAVGAVRGDAGSAAEFAGPDGRAVGGRDADHGGLGLGLAGEERGQGGGLEGDGQDCQHVLDGDHVG